MISIIMPVYNVEKNLESCLDSVLSQTYQDIEIICVNDCGSDRSLDILKKYQEIYSEKITIIMNEKNLGVGAARDAGIARANGQYLAFVDSDDMIDQDYLETYYNVMKRENAHCVCGGYTIKKGDTMKKANYGKKVVPENSFELQWLWAPVWGRMFDREFLAEKNINFRGARICEDELFNYRFMFNHPKVKMIDYSGYNYRINDSSLIHDNQDGTREKVFYQSISYIKDFCQEFEKVKLSPIERELFEYGIISSIITNGLCNGKSSGSVNMKKIKEESFAVIDRFFPDFYKNRYLKIANTPKIWEKKKIYTYLVTKMHRFHLDGLIYSIVGKL